MAKKVFIFEIDLFSRLRYEIYTDKGKVVYFVVKLEALIGNNWEAIVRYDTTHGFFHRDIMKPDGEKEKKEFDITDFNTALQFADNDLRDRSEWYIDQYMKKIKK